MEGGEQIAQREGELVGQGVPDDLAPRVERGLPGEEDQVSAGGDDRVAESGGRGEFGGVDPVGRAHAGGSWVGGATDGGSWTAEGSGGAAEGAGAVPGGLGPRGRRAAFAYSSLAMMARCTSLAPS